MARATWIPAALRNRGLRVELVGGWETRGSDAFAPRGVVCHHTASAQGKNAPSLNVVIKGRPDLPGPLCHVLLARDGTCYVIAAGRANHAGAGGWKGLSGNGTVLGIEAENDGVGEPWPKAQLDAFERCAAALAQGAGVSAEMVCAHREWAPHRKTDPHGIDMGQFRSVVHSLLTGDPDMPLTDADVEKIAKRVVEILRAPEFNIAHIRENTDQILTAVKQP